MISSNYNNNQFVHFKVYFTIVSYQYYSYMKINKQTYESESIMLSENIIFMIEKLKIDIEKDRV